ncbi:MAG TPA: flagellar protein FlgN [Dehalococcoidia bacterium]
MGKTKAQRTALPHTRLVQVLEEENAVYGELVALSEAEYQAILAARIDELTELLINKERLLARAQALEEARQAEVRAVVGDAAAASARLEDLASRLEGAERERLLAVRDSLRENISRLTAANDRNGAVLRGGLQLIGRWINFLAGYAAAAVTYAQDGSATPKAGRTILDRQA